MQGTNRKCFFYCTKEKIFLFSLNLYRINSKNPIYVEVNTVQIAHFPLKNTEENIGHNQTILLEWVIQIFMSFLWPTILSVGYKPLKGQLNEFFQLYQTVENKYIFSRKFIFKTLILMIPKNFNGTGRNGFGKRSNSFRNRLKPVVKLQTQRPNEVPKDHRENWTHYWMLCTKMKEWLKVKKISSTLLKKIEERFFWLHCFS